MQNFSKIDRVAAGIFFIWFFIHLGLFFYADEGPDNNFFWPFYSADKSLAATYSVSEFLFYTSTPLVLFIAYRIVFGNDNDPSSSSRRHSGNYFNAFLDEKIKAEELSQKLNELQNLPVNYELLNDLKSDKEKSTDQNVNHWLEKVEVKKKYKDFEN